MAEPICEDDGVLQEWAPETKLLQQIPLRVQRGLFSHNLNLTCVDVVPEYIALGTNCGLIYWYCRATNDLQRLRLENSTNTVTCVKIVSTVDYMVAAGTDRGNVTVFQIPKILPDCLPDSLKPKKNQVERFTINGLHNAPVTNIEWSQNGMKLFSGDKNGLVVLTEIDFYMHLSKSTELLNEQFEIVQLSYNQQVLLISTTFRSIICDGLDKWKVHQVGTKERKILGKFGATICKFDHGSVVYASRPGHRLWLANKTGTVQQTLMFKSAIPSSYPRIQLINPVNKIESCDTSFGKLKQFAGNKLIAYNSEILYILHPGAISVVASLDSARRILDLAVNGDEIFILEGERSLLRIGYAPDKYGFDIAEGSSRRRSFIFDDFASRLKDTAMESLKKITSELIVTPEQTSPNSPPALADEALDLPPIVNLPEGSISSIVPEENVEVHFSVDEDGKPDGQQKSLPSCSGEGDVFKFKESEEVISRPLRRRHQKKSRIFTAVQEQESESDTTSNASDERLVWGVANELSISEESGLSFSQSQSSFSVLRDIPTLLTANNPKTVKAESLQDETSKTPDDKSQASLDTCESVSEHLRLTPERFLEEQEKTFFRLANQDISLLDSYNSEKTDNMSISLNMTPSSSVSSKISDNVQSTSEMSENVSMISETKTENSSSNSQNDLLPLPKHLCFYNNVEGSASSPEDKHTISANTSASSNNSQRLSQIILEPDNLNWIHAGKPIRVEEWKQSKIEHFMEDVEQVEDETADGEVNVELDSGDFADRTLSHETDTVEETIHEDNNEEKVDDGKQTESKDPLTVEAISYGPPSGSSTLDRNTTLECPFSANFNTFMELSDHWIQHKFPGSVACLDLASNYAICVDSRENVYFTKLTDISLSWILLSYKASWINLSNNTSLVWILQKSKLFSLTDPTAIALPSDPIFQQDVSARAFALDSDNPEGWVVMKDGRVLLLRNLSAVPVASEEVPCDWYLTNLVCWKGTVLAITTDETVVCKPREEERFRSVLTPNHLTRYIALGPDNLAWIVDNHNKIYFSDDFLSDEPHWWQVLISGYLYQNPSSMLKNVQEKIMSNIIGPHVGSKTTMIACNENSVWVFEKHSNTVSVNKIGFTGYIWNKIGLNLSVPSIRWRTISACGIFENCGHLWLLSNEGILFCSKPESKHLQSMPTPCTDIRCISSSTDALWVLSTEGQIFSRLGLSNKNLIGTSWKEVHLPEFDELKLIWISCGSDVAWGCDSKGRIFLTINSRCHMTSNVFDSAWLEVDGHPNSGNKFEKVFVGPNLFMVWAIDNKQNVYVREGIFPDLPVGTSWVLVVGVKASSITISGTSVWALSPTGQIYRRCGISESNYIGDYWRDIPGNLEAFTSSFTDELWGIDFGNSILKMSRKIKTLSGRKEPEALEDQLESSLEDFCKI